MAPATPVLQIIIGSTRPGRKGPAVARWFDGVARAHGDFEVELIDLAEVALPFFDEPGHPMLGVYQHEHTKRWSASVERADAVVWVMPEYNHSFAATVKNALDFLHHEWANKPVGFVSYGGVAAGIRAQQSLKPTLSALKMVVVNESVSIPNFGAHIVGDDFVAPEGLDGAANALLDSLHGWAATLAHRRA